MLTRWKSWSDIFILLTIHAVVALAWNTVYDLEGGHAYLQLQNNDIIKIDFAIDGDLKADIKSDDSLPVYCTAPDNSTIFLHQGELHGFISAPPKKSTRSKDVCGDGLLGLRAYNESARSWDSVSLASNAFDELDDASFYDSATYLAADDTLYIYGGLCQPSSEITSRLISFDFEKKVFSNISTSTKPQPFYGASNILGPDAQTQLVIGGQTNKGWLNMYQLATWNFDSGWSFKSVATGNDKINSRKFALALPLFDPLSNDSVAEIQSHFSVKSVLLIGGENFNQPSTPAVAKLATNDASWTWQQLDLDIDPQQILGAASIFNTLLVVNQDSTKRGSSYTVTLYDTDNLKQVSSLKDNYSSKFASTGDSNSVPKKAILGTILPVAAIAAAIAASLFVIKRRRASAAEPKDDDIDYHFGTFYDQTSTTHPYNNRVAADSASTLDGASIDSWVRKRQEYEEKRSKFHNDHWTSKDTLTSGEYNEEHELPDKPLPTPLQGSVMTRSVSKVKGSFSFTNAPGSPRMLLSPKNLTGPRTLREKASEKTLISTGGRLFDDEMSSENPADSDAHSDYDSDNSLDEMMDVQVLVSSKRRSVLKVMNPDVTAGGDMRQRVPSDEAKEHEDA